MSLFMGVILKEGEKMSDIKTKSNKFVSNFLCIRQHNKKDTIIIPTGSSLIFKVRLVKEKKTKLESKIPKQLVFLLFIQL